jgi:sugar lactone lactonase YvrE
MLRDDDGASAAGCRVRHCPPPRVYLYYKQPMSKPPATSPTDAPAVRVAWPLAAQLGEGPAWIAAEQALWFVDIEGRRLHRYAPADDACDSYPVDGRPSFIVPASDGGMLAGIDLSLRRVGDGGPGATIASVPDATGCRTNDAVVDARGRLWFGTMDLGERAPLGQVHRFDRGTLRALGAHCAITNGPALSPDGARLYHVDTLGGVVWAFDLAALDAGARDTLADGRVFARIAAADGTPDGVTVDSEGCVWVALWGGGGVRRYAADGALLLQVALPCAQVTKVAFGGPDLRTAFVTTARVGLSAAALRGQPLAGALFAFDAPAPGLPQHAVRLP